MKMKHYLTVALILCIGLGGCTKDAQQGNAETGQKNLTITLAGLNTRAGDPADAFAKTTKNIGSLAVFVTDASDKILATRTIQKSDQPDSDWDKITNPAKDGYKILNVNYGASKVYVYGNPGTYVTGAEGGKISVAATLAAQQGSAVLYSGVDAQLTHVTDENPDVPGGKLTTYTAEVKIAPLMARMQIKQVEFLAAGSQVVKKKVGGTDKQATVAWTGFGGDLVGVYFNNFWNKCADGVNSQLQNNTDHAKIADGKWMFGSVDAAAYASYNKWNGSAYAPYTLPLADGKCFGFNFFPGGEVPMLHFDLANLVKTTLTSTDEAVYNPALFGELRFANVVRFLDADDNEMDGDDFKAGSLYNLSVQIKPCFLDRGIVNIQYDVIVKVTVEDWKLVDITPGFEGM